MAKEVLIVGGGVAGLTAALELAKMNLRSTIVEKGNFPGGHAIRFTCKAADTCVKCGACMVEEKLKYASAHPDITIQTGSKVCKLEKNGSFAATIESMPVFIDPHRCNNCGICFQKCPFEAIDRGSSAHHIPWYALNRKKCRYVLDGSCTICQDECPEKAISLDKKSKNHTARVDAVLIASGFQVYNPVDKPYGYGLFPNVITNLDLEHLLRLKGSVLRPSDDQAPDRIAFIQCVGSRDAKLGHLWCSKVCCGSALRMARLIKKRRPETDLTVFYMDIQTYGKDFDRFYTDSQAEIHFQRAIPADIYPDKEDGLMVTFFDSSTRESRQEQFDLVVLSVGLMPGSDNTDLAETFGLNADGDGFFDNADMRSENGVFVTGASLGPMSIAESIANAGQAAWQVYRHLNSQV